MVHSMPGSFVLPRYVATDALKPTLLGLFAMLGIVWLLQSLRFLDLMINKGLALTTFLHLTLLLLPMLLTIILPISLFIGACAMLRRWQEDSELTVLLATGQSPLALLGPLVGWAGVAIVIGFLNYMVVLPWSTGAFKDMQYEIRTQQGQLLLEEGTFNQLGNNLMLFLKKRVTPTSLEQILVHDTREPGRPVTWYARTGNVSFMADGTPRLVLHNGLRQAVTDKQIDMLEFESYTLDIHQTLDAKSPLSRAKEEEEFSIPELLNLIQNATTPAKHGLYAEQLSKRFLWPLTPLPLVLLAAAWLLRPPRRTQGSSRFLAGAGLSAVAYMGLLTGLSGLAQGGAIWALYVQWLLPLLGFVAAWMIAEKSTFTDPEGNPNTPEGRVLS